MPRIMLHGHIPNLLEFVHPLDNFFQDIVKYDRLSIFSLVFYASLDAFLLLLLNLVKYIHQDSPFVSALKVDILLVFLLQRLDSFVPQIHDGGAIGVIGLGVAMCFRV